ncbi:MAG: type II secretion system F family protein [archaeon]
MFSGISALFAAFVPKKFIDGFVKPSLNYAGSKDDARRWLGLRIFISTLVGGILFLFPFSVFPLLNVIFDLEIYFEFPFNLLVMIGLGIAGFVFAMTIFYLHISYVIDGRKKMVENILPDFLFLVGNNLRSGMAPFYAFRSAVRPEFGPLSEEIKIATQKSLGLESFSDALKNIGLRINSKVLSDTTKFFASALRSGGHLAQLIETTASDIKQTNRLKKELVTSTRMYTLFILFVVIVASPMLLAVSIEFLNILSGVQKETAGTNSGVDPTAGGQIGFTSTPIGITSEFMTIIGYFLVIVNSLLASIFIGILGGGKIREGVKYAPLMAIAGLVLLTIFTSAIGGLVGGFG